MPLWQVFIGNRSGLPHKHCGSEAGCLNSLLCIGVS
jgi:1,2-phenylacetyl-CoA epoxidase PaaB subunit